MIILSFLSSYQHSLILRRISTTDPQEMKLCVISKIVDSQEEEKRGVVFIIIAKINK